MILVALIGLGLSPLSPARDARPLALVGGGYGTHEVTSIVRNILDQEDWVFESRGTFLPAGEFEKYALVVIASSQDRPYTAAEQEIIRQYLEQGGQLLLIQQAPRNMADAESAAAQSQWLGMSQQAIKAIDPEKAVVAQDPVLKGVVSPAGPRPSWIGGSQGVVHLAEGVQALIGEGDRALVARRDVGKGRVYYLGSEVFRLRLANSPHRKDSESYLTLIRNILSEANPLTFTQWRESLAKDWKEQGRRFLIWNREWQRGNEKEPIFQPPLPGPSELVATWPVQLALNEREAVQFNITDLGKGGLVTWKVEGLPGQAVTVFVQDKPNPIPWPKNPALAREAPFWLMPPEEVEPKGQPGVKIGLQGTRIFWLKFDTSHLDPGSYHGRLAFSVNGKPAGEVALEVTVHPVRVPARRSITLQPLGHVYGDVNEAPPARRFHRNLRDLGYEWSLINTLRPETFTVGGKPLDRTFIKEHLEAITAGQSPVIDFSSMDAFIDDALDHNLTYFRATQNITESINGLVKGIVTTDEQEKAVRQWYLREFARYLKDKGIRNIYVSMGDEMSIKELWERFIPWSDDLAGAGLPTTSSFTTSAVADFPLAQALSRNVGAWTFNRLHTGTFMAWVREGKIQLAERALVGSYGAGEGRGTETQKNASASRMIGWEAWSLGLDYCAPNPYFKGWLYYTDYSADRGVSGERMVAFLDKDNLEAPLLNSPFIEGIRESMEEANLAALMSWYLQKLGDRVPESLRQRAQRIVGKDTSSIIRWQPTQYLDYTSDVIDASREEYTRAKNEVLAILDELRPLARQAHIQPSLFWHDIPLIQDGRPVATISTEQDVAPLQTAIKAAVGLELPLGEGGKTRIVVENPQERKDAPKNSSWIRDATDPKTGVITLQIGGTDAAQLAKALKQFTYFFRSEGNAFAP